MTTIEIECASGSADISAATKKAIEVLRQAGIKTRQRSRSLEKKGLVQVPDADAERALNLLAAANIRASVRPS
jgi:muramoyltetrapeptide carboxypeptidase LdcA involved in peptidoglycan recycling